MDSEQLEIARKYDVPTAAALPALTGLPKVVSVDQRLKSTFDAVYCDTDGLALANAGITVRRRTGGADAGWHLKLPGRGDDRSELGEPLTDDTDVVPPELLRHIRAWVRDSPLRPVATLSTRRVVHRLIGDGGRVLAEVGDDVVTAHATPVQGEAIVSSWREWEIELVTGSRKLLAAADELFVRAGAAPSVWPSKLHHSLGRHPRTPAVNGAKLTDKSPAGEVIVGYLADQIAVILAIDGEVRRGAPESVHKMRVATRRLRSALSTFRPLFDRLITDRIRSELKWLAGALGGARDAEVQRMHLMAAVAAEPDDLVLGPVAGRMEVELLSTYRAAHDALLADLDSERYFRLLDTLDELRAAPPLTDLAGAKAKIVLRQRIRKVGKDLYTVSSRDPGTGRSRDGWLHEIRKAAKRLRYAAEAARPVLGRSATTLAAAAENLQEVLGEHQDSVMTRATLRSIGVQMFADGENAFTVGRLHGLQQARAEAADAAFTALWPTFVAEHLRGRPAE